MTELLTAPKRNPKSLANLRKGGGRPKGVPNKVTAEAKLACAEIVDDPEYRAKLTARAKSGKLPPALECLLWYYAKGKPRETIEHHDRRDIAAMSDAELESALRASMEKLGYRVVPASTE